MIGRFYMGVEKTWGQTAEIAFCLFDASIRDGCPDLKNLVSADRYEAHLAPVVHPGIDEIVGSILSRRTGYR